MPPSTRKRNLERHEPRLGDLPARPAADAPLCPSEQRHHDKARRSERDPDDALLWVRAVYECADGLERNVGSQDEELNRYQLLGAFLCVVRQRPPAREPPDDDHAGEALDRRVEPKPISAIEPAAMPAATAPSPSSACSRGWPMTATWRGARAAGSRLSHGLAGRLPLPRGYAGSASSTPRWWRGRARRPGGGLPLPPAVPTWAASWPPGRESPP